MFCPKCGDETEEGTKFCGKCGEPVGEPGPGEAPRSPGVRRRSYKNKLVKSDAERLGKSALTYAIIGIFCLGFILEPVALIMGIKALNAANRSPNPAPKGNAIAAIVISSILLGLFLLSIIVMVLAEALQ